MRTFRILSLGAGVQSTVLALMGVRGDLKIDAAIFADTGAEPAAVMRHLDWLVKECAPYFPVYIRQKGNILEDLSRGENSDGGRFATAPFFTLHPDGSKGITRRQCTSEYKIDVVERCVRRDILGLEPRKHIPKDVRIVQLIGMSAEEGRRVARVRARFASDGLGIPEFPLYVRWMAREDCIKWLKDYGVPHEVPRSACIFCPYKSDAEWVRLREESPEEWGKVVEFDALIRKPGLFLNRGLESDRYLHASCRPIGEVEFNPKASKIEQFTLPGMADVCEGMCGT